MAKAEAEAQAAREAEHKARTEGAPCLCVHSKCDSVKKHGDMSAQVLLTCVVFAAPHACLHQVAAC